MKCVFLFCCVFY